MAPLWKKREILLGQRRSRGITGAPKKRLGRTGPSGPLPLPGRPKVIVNEMPIAPNKPSVFAAAPPVRRGTPIFECTLRACPLPGDFWFKRMPQSQADFGGRVFTVLFFSLRPVFFLFSPETTSA